MSKPTKERVVDEITRYSLAGMLEGWVVTVTVGWWNVRVSITMGTVMISYDWDYNEEMTWDEFIRCYAGNRA